MATGHQWVAGAAHLGPRAARRGVPWAGPRVARWAVPVGLPLRVGAQSVARADLALLAAAPWAVRAGSGPAARVDRRLDSDLAWVAAAVMAERGKTCARISISCGRWNGSAWCST